tara:strand:- start:665 stop:934 length:270 start_codon:yes stop_codon:yes gene_type:complete
LRQGRNLSFNNQALCQSTPISPLSFYNRKNFHQNPVNTRPAANQRYAEKDDCQLCIPVDLPTAIRSNIKESDIAFSWHGLSASIFYCEI